MKARYWKIRKEHKLCASLAGGVPARRNNSLPSWEGDRALDEYFGVPTAPRHETLVPGAPGPPWAGGYRTRYEYEPKMGVDKKGYPAL